VFDGEFSKYQYEWEKLISDAEYLHYYNQNDSLALTDPNLSKVQNQNQ
jgi:hypothetical protein